MHHLLVKIPIAVADCAPQGGGSPFLPDRHELAAAVDGDKWRSSAAYKFRANGGCGFMKKPDILMKADQDNKVFDPKAKSPVKKTLKVKVYMGDGWHMDFKQTHFDSYSPPDFYARVGIAGAPADEIMKKTKAIEDNWTPLWDKEFTFPLTILELALLRIEVHEYDLSVKDDFD